MDSDRTQSRRLGFGRRIYGMRVLGLGLGAIAVGGALHADHAPAWLWALLAFDGYLWPHVAWQWVRFSRDPVRAEYRNLMLDSAMGGFWIAAMGFDLLPSLILAVLLTVDKIMAGGPRFSLKTLAAMAATCALASAAFGFRFEPVTAFPTMVACLPLMVVYTLALGLLANLLGRRLARQKEQLERSSRFDAATGLMNRQQWLYAANQELARFQRSACPAVLMMIDIDCFKQINDGHGHTIGDGVIEEFARLMRASLRDVDSGGRYGGDEFGIVMPDTRWQEAIVAAERLRRLVAAYTGFPGGLRATISVGLAEIEPGLADVSAWVDAADAALYRAKRRGRDCIEVRPSGGFGA